MINMPKEDNGAKEIDPEEKTNNIRQGSLSHQKAIVCKGKIGSHGWDLKKKKYEKKAS
jgi:hypothetical protein